MSHFAVAPMPLGYFLDVITDPEAPERPELIDVQRALSEHCGAEIIWDEPEPPEEVEVFPLEAECLFSLKTAGAWLQLRGHLEDFQPGDDPLEHPVWQEVAEAPGDERFAQLVNTWTADVVYVPVHMDGVVETEWHGPGDDGYVLLVGSLPALRTELVELGRALGFDPEHHEERHLFDEDVDPLAAARYAWQVLWQQLDVAERDHLPLFVTWDPTSAGDAFDA